MRLSDLPPHARARIVRLHVESNERLRLVAFGLVPGDTIEVGHRAPFGGPIEVRLERTSVALGRAYADAIEVERL